VKTLRVTRAASAVEFLEDRSEVTRGLREGRALAHYRARLLTIEIHGPLGQGLACFHSPHWKEISGCNNLCIVALASGAV